MEKVKIELNYVSFAFFSLVILVGLKLTNIITWSWWFVISPLWLPWVMLILSYFTIKFMSYLLIGKRIYVKKQK